MKCLICNESSVKSLCDDCSNKKRCNDCDKVKSDSKADFYSYKNGKMYSTCKDCFSKKVRCEFCNKEINKCFLSSHNKKQHMQHNMRQQHSQYYGGGIAQEHSQQHSQLRDSFRNDGDIINIKNSFKCVTEDVTNGAANGNDALLHCSTLIVGPSICGKTLLLLNKLQLIRLNEYETNSPPRQIRIVTRSPEQYKHIQLEEIEVEENVGDLEMYRGCCVVFMC